MRPWLVAIALISLLAACGPSFDERHLDGIDLSSATIRDFRTKYGPEEERNPLYILGVPVYHRLRFRLRHEDAARITTAPSGPLFVDEGSSHNAIRVWLPLPKAPGSYEDARAKWDAPRRTIIIGAGQAATLPVNLVGMHYAEFDVQDMEIGAFYDGESDRIAMLTWAPVLMDPGPTPDARPKDLASANSGDFSPLP